MYLNGDEWQFFVRNIAVPNYQQVIVGEEKWEETVSRRGYSTARSFGEKAVVWRSKDQEVPSSMFSYAEMSKIRLIRSHDPKDKRTTGSEWPGSNVVTMRYSDYKDPRSWLYCDKFSEFPHLWLEYVCPIGRIGVAAMTQMNEHTRGIFSLQFIRTSESLKLWEKGMYPEFENDQRSGYSGRMKWDGTDLDHKGEDKNELVVTFEVSQLYVANILAISREGWQASSRAELTKKLKQQAERTNGGQEPPCETFLWNQKSAPDMVRDKCVIPPEARWKVKIPAPENISKGECIYQPNQSNSILHEMREANTRVSQVTLLKRPDLEENQEENSKQQSNRKWNSSAVFSEEKHKSYDDQFADVSDSEVQRLEEALARRKQKADPNDDVCIRGKGCKNGEWQKSQGKQPYQVPSSGKNNNNDWNGWKESNWQESRNLQKAYGERNLKQWDSKEQANEPSESSEGRKRSGQKVAVEPMASAVWGRKKFAAHNTRY